MTKYRKAIAAGVALALAALGVLATALSDGTVTPAEWVAIAYAAIAAFGGTLGVYQVKNEQ